MILLWLLFADVAITQPPADVALFATVKFNAVTDFELHQGKKILWKRAAPESIALSRPKSGTVEARLLPAPFYRVLVRDDAIVVALSNHLFVLRRSDGATLLDERLTEVGFGDLLFDRAKVTAQIDGGATCTFDAVQSRFLANCGSRVFYYFGPALIALQSSPWKIDASAMILDVPVRDKEGAWRIECGSAHFKIQPQQ